MAVEVIEKADQLDDRAVAAKQSKDEADKLIEAFKPFLYGKAAKYSLADDEYQREEMFSVAMIAFYESIQSYNSEKGHFFPFANDVVSKRIIDYIRKIYRNDGKTTPLEDQDSEKSSAQSDAIGKMSMQIYTAQRRQNKF